MDLSTDAGPSVGDIIRLGHSTPGVQRAAVRLARTAFTPHRHDTYAIGITVAGVQRFSYRGHQRVCLPGQLHILHPDETHDGGPGTEAGFAYRILYVAPSTIQEALDGAPLPFVADPVQPAARARRLAAALMVDLDDPMTDLGRTDLAVTIADTLTDLGGGSVEQPSLLDLRAVDQAREYLDGCAEDAPSATTLEQVSGTDRYTLTRHFRRALGTTPDRYRTLRRLDRARRMIEQGEPLAAVAARCGFADQPHMTRQFKRAFGFTPGRWAVLTGGVPTVSR